MKKNGFKKLFSIVLAVALILTNFVGVGSVQLVKAETTTVLSEGFDGVVLSGSYIDRNSVPAGWTFTKGTGTDMATYAASTAGKAAPSIKIQGTGNQIVTPTFALTAPGTLSFWMKGTGQNAGDTFKIEKYDGTSWLTVDNIDPSTVYSAAATKSYQLESNIVQVRFTYDKPVSGTNVALDDVLITQDGGTPATVAVEGVTVTPSTLTIGVGQTSQLTATIAPSTATNKTVSWSSSNTSVASVDASTGVVTGVAEGIATITVTTADGGKTADCTVTVTSSVPVTGVSLDKETETVEIGQSTNLVATVAPADASNKSITWSTSNNKVADVDQTGKVTAMSEGTATITVTTGDGKFTDACEITVPAIQKYNIVDVRDMQKDTKVTIEGTVTYIDGTQKFYIQDSTAAIVMDTFGTTGVPSPVKGDLIKLSGTLTSFNSLLTIKPYPATVIVTPGAGVMPQPRLITASEVNKEDYEAQLVRIENATLGATDSTTKLTEITDSTGIAKIYSMPAVAGLVSGDRLNVTAIVSQYNKTTDPSAGYQLRIRDASEIQKIEVPDTEKPVIIHTPVVAGNIGAGLEIKAQVTDNKQVASVKLYYRVKGQAEYKTIDMLPANGEYSAEIPVADISLLGMQYYIEASDGNNIATMPIDKTAPYEITIANIDATGPELTIVSPASGESTGTNLRPVIKASYADVSGINKGTVALYVDNVDVTTKAAVTETDITYTPDTDLANGEHFVKLVVWDNASPVSNRTELIWNFFAGEQQYKNYFGQLHSHTVNSDGSGTLTEAYTYARDNAKLDFFAVTDHSNSYDAKPATDKAGTYNLGDYNKDNPKWVAGQKAASDARRDNFISVYAYEMTWSGGPGHINTFATDGFVSRNNTELNNKTGDAGMKAYYDLLKATPNSISQFNHPGKTFGTFSDFAYLDPVIDARISLIEVGNGEGAVGSGSYFPSYDEYNKALDKGWHLAPTNNQDNHKGKWGDANTARTVIYTNDLSVNGLYDALRDMRVYATEDNDLDIVYTLNGEMLGSIIQDVPGQASFDVSVSDPDSNDKIQSISIVSNGGKDIYTQTYESQNATLEKTINAPAAGYYYIRVVEEDGQIAVTAPIWLGSAPKVGINSLEYDTIMPVTNESVNFTTKLFNNESEPVTVKSISYTTKDGITIGTNNPNENIPSSGMYTHVQNYTFTQPGTYTVTVTAVVSQNGKDTTYTKDIEINVRDSAKLVYVGIDASHDNEYVSGNYKASMGNFAKLAAKFGVRVVELNTSAALIEAMQNPKYEMMVFTVPSRRNGTAGRIPFKSYSQSEIDAAAAFAKSGRTVIVTGWGDYYESYSNLKSEASFTAEQHMAAQQNKLLAAIGASLRISDDEAKDNSQNGGQAQRLYLTDFNNYQDPLTQGIVDGQVFSQYGGSTIFAVDSNGNPSSELPANIKPTISGHATTYSSDDDKDSNAVPPKYNNKVLLMANETVTHEDGTMSTVIAAGGAFMSNFEIQVEVDNASTLPYGNYNILQNIIATLANISTIADVHNMANGTDVVIEGIATTDVYNGSDSNKGFFDCIYVQDQTGGINLFPVSSGVEAGQRIRVTGRVSEYQGEKQIENAKVTVINRNKNLVTPKEVTPEEAMLPANTGSLVTFKGTVTEIIKGNDGTVGQLMVSGARVYINGYITKNISLANIEIGDTVKVTGIASIGENMSSSTEFLPRIRVRDRGEVELVDVLPDFEIEKVSPTSNEFKLGSDAVVTVKVTNRKTVAKEATLIIALFDSNNRFVTYAASGQTIDGGKTSNLTAMFKIPQTGNYNIRCFVWDSIGGMKALSDVMEFEVK